MFLHHGQCVCVFSDKSTTPTLVCSAKNKHRLVSESQQTKLNGVILSSLSFAIADANIERRFSQSPCYPRTERVGIDRDQHDGMICVEYAIPSYKSNVHPDKTSHTVSLFPQKMVLNSNRHGDCHQMDAHFSPYDQCQHTTRTLSTAAFGPTASGNLSVQRRRRKRLMSPPQSI